MKTDKDIMEPEFEKQLLKEIDDASGITAAETAMNDTEYLSKMAEKECSKAEKASHGISYKKEDFESLSIKTSTKSGTPHKLTCSGKQAQGEDLKEAAVGLCRELGIKFDSPAALAQILKVDFPANHNRDLLISFLEPVRTGEKIKEPISIL